MVADILDMIALITRVVQVAAMQSPVAVAVAISQEEPAETPGASLEMAAGQVTTTKLEMRQRPRFVMQPRSAQTSSCQVEGTLRLKFSGPKSTDCQKRFCCTPSLSVIARKQQKPKLGAILSFGAISLTMIVA